MGSLKSSTTPWWLAAPLILTLSVIRQDKPKTLQHWGNLFHKWILSFSGVLHAEVCYSDLFGIE